MLTYHKAILDAPAYYEDVDTRQRFRRVTGGISWPQADAAGVALVLVEDFSEPSRYRVLTSVNEYNALSLLWTCKGMELEYPVRGWHTNCENVAMMQLVYEFNKDRYHEDKIKVMGAPLAGEDNNSGYYLPIILDMGKAGAERIMAKDSEEVALAMEEIDSETHFNRNIAQFPVLAALCYPLSYLLTYKAVKPMPTKLDLKRYGGHAWRL